MPDIIIDDCETTRILDFWLKVKVATQEAIAASVDDSSQYTSNQLLDLPHTVMDYVIEIEPLIQSLANLQMKRRHDD